MELLNDVECENIKLLSEYGQLNDELVSPQYGSLYPVYEKRQEELTAEDSACIIYEAFSAVDKIMVEDEVMLSEELSDDVIKFYQLEYNMQGMKAYLSEYFSSELFSYLTNVFNAMFLLWYNEDDGKFYISRDGTPAYDNYEIDYFREFKLISQDDSRCKVSVPFVFLTTDNPVEDRGEMILEQNEQGKWIISNMSLAYYDKIF